MSWNLSIRGKSVKLKPVDSLRLVYPTRQFRSTASPEDYESNFGRVVTSYEEAAAAGIRESDCSIFRQAGWSFVDPKEEVASATILQQPVPHAASAREIFVGESGSMLVTTGLACVKLRESLSEAEVKAIFERDRLTIVHKLGFRPNLYEVRVPAGVSLMETIDALKKKTDYEWVEPSLLQTIKTKEALPVTQLESNPDFKLQWHHRNTGFKGIVKLGEAGEDLGSIEAWEITKGEGVRVAVIDSGMQIDHPDLSGAIIRGGFFRDNASGESPFVGLESGTTDFPNVHHGTFCMTLIGGRMSGTDLQNMGGCGIAPKADLIAIACPVDQLATQTTLARAIHFAVDPSAFIPSAKPDEGADVISCSLDTDRPLFKVLAEAVNYAGTEGRNGLGVPIFWAVNNEDTPISDDPVCDLDEVIAVGRYDRSGDRAEGGIGEHLAFLAPGVDIFSSSNDGLFQTDDGTSFATPLAAGVAALVLAANPGMNAVDLRKKLAAGCRPIPDSNPEEVGAGKLNAFNALN